MILIIAEDKEKIEIAKKHLYELLWAFKNPAGNQMITCTYVKRGARLFIYYGKKAKELAQEANMVYLYREKLIRLK